MRTSISVATAQIRMPANAEIVPFSMLPMVPKNPKKQIALRTVFSTLIAATQVKNATIAQIAEMSLSPMFVVGKVAVPELRIDILLCS